MSKTYTSEEVVKHNREKDLWIVYKDGVYDITKFYNEHPGGEEVLLDLAGKDATICFDEIGHSTEAIELREKYKIGTLVGSVSGAASIVSGEQTTTVEDDDNWEYDPPKYESSPMLPVFIAAAVVVYAYIFYYFWYS